MQKRRGQHYGWSKTSLITLFFTYSGCAVAESSVSSSVVLTSNDLLKVITAFATVLLAQAFIPATRNALKDRSEQRTFRIYLYTHALNTKASYGEESSVSLAEQLISSPERPAWLETLDSAGLGVPSSLLDMHLALEKAQNQPELEEEHRYVPYLSYFGVTGTPLEINSPLWKSSDDVSKRASSYLITESQISTSIEAQYEPEFLSLIRKGNSEQRQRWCEAGRGVLLDMSEHYVATVRLLNELKRTMKF